jgi:hypothetical protein
LARRRVETDSGGATYEAHLTKADGSTLTVERDASFTVTAALHSRRHRLGKGAEATGLRTSVRGPRGWPDWELSQVVFRKFSGQVALLH